MNQPEWINRIMRKTEFSQVGSRHQLLKCKSNLINVCDVTVTKSDSLKYLGVYLCIDSQLSLKEQIRKTCKIAATDACHLQALALVTSHLDYRSAIYY